MVNNWSIFGRLLGGQCPLCGSPGPSICPSCRTMLPHNNNACRICAVPLTHDCEADICADCQRQTPPYEKVTAALRYSPPVDDLVARFKYHGNLAIGRLLAEIMLEDDRLKRHGLLVPVPASAPRLRERGFNQAAELCRHLALAHETAWTPNLLIRHRHASNQRLLQRSERLRNLRNTFACGARAPRHVTLVDDVMTTGATVSECTRALKSAGAERVDVWVVARTPASTHRHRTPKGD